MLAGTTIDGMLVGGPAFNCQEMARSVELISLTVF